MRFQEKSLQDASFLHDQERRKTPTYPPFSEQGFDKVKSLWKEKGGGSGEGRGNLSSERFPLSSHGPPPLTFPRLLTLSNPCSWWGKKSTLFPVKTALKRTPEATMLREFFLSKSKKRTCRFELPVIQRNSCRTALHQS